MGQIFQVLEEREEPVPFPMQFFYNYRLFTLYIRIGPMCEHCHTEFVPLHTHICAYPLHIHMLAHMKTINKNKVFKEARTLACYQVLVLQKHLVPSSPCHKNSAPKEFYFSILIQDPASEHMLASRVEEN